MAEWPEGLRDPELIPSETASGHARRQELVAAARMDYHPDPAIDAEIRLDTIAAEQADLAAGYPARWWTCPECGASHQRGWFLGVGQHRCLRCGYVGPRGAMHTNRPPTPASAEEAVRDYAMELLTPASAETLREAAESMAADMRGEYEG